MILIKDLDIPENGYVDIRLFSDGTASTHSSKEPFFREMPIVTVDKNLQPLLEQPNIFAAGFKQCDDGQDIVITKYIKCDDTPVSYVVMTLGHLVAEAMGAIKNYNAPEKFSVLSGVAACALRLFAEGLSDDEKAECEGLDEFLRMEGEGVES